MDNELISKTIAKVVREMRLAKASDSNLATAYNNSGVAERKVINLELATELINAVTRESEKRGMKTVVAVVNAFGNPVAVHCMDGSYLVSYKVATDKAYTSAALKMPTKKLAKLVEQGGDFYGLQFNNDRIVVFGGGEPLEYNGEVIGAVGVSGGTAEEDSALGEFAKNKFKEMVSWHLTKR